MYIKHHHYFLFLIALMMPVMTQAQTQTLVLWHANGTTTDVDLYTDPKVTFTDTTLLISSTVLDMEFPAEEIVRFTYKERDTSIESLKDTIDFRQEDGCIRFNGLRGHVAIYRPDGFRIPVPLTIEGVGKAILPLSSLPRGTYIISVNGRTSKFIRK